MTAGTTVATFSANDSTPTPRLVAVLPEAVIATDTTTCPNTGTTYTLGDIVGNSATAGSMVALAPVVARVNSGKFSLERIKIVLTSTDTGFLAQPIIVKIYGAAPTFTVGDDGVWASNVSESGLMGQVTVVLDQSTGAGSQVTLVGVGVPDKSDRIMCQADSSAKIYAVLVAGSSIVRGAVTHSFSVQFEGYAL